ncbi:hypothetical protein [Streptomyces marianii]|uniref:Uncharacterized protein n=1 Tax=Streptomyces marianii TaxID=1817406 RepID=A0A5R9E6W4_9ACTN|nr:hypothetical protein [Streptomyces marianii]TLQ45771.1 hypothetical protein FEF34_24735 [Streptomyces marianii]
MIAIRLARGTGRLAWRTWTRLRAAGERHDDQLGPYIAVTLSLAALGYVLSAVPILGTPLTLAWALAAYRAGAPEETAPVPADDAPEPGEQPSAEPEEEQLLPTREELAAALHQLAAPHVHLTALAAHFGLSSGQLREACDGAGIPVAGGVRMGGRVSTGVRAPDFPTLSPDPEPVPESVVAAGQSNNNNAQASTEEGFSITQDPVNHHRWRVTKAGN